MNINIEPNIMNQYHQHQLHEVNLNSIHNNNTIISMVIECFLFVEYKQI